MIRRPGPVHRPNPAEHGVAAVEFALVLPVVVAMLTGIVLTGLVFVDQLQVQAAAHDGARAGVVAAGQGCATALERLAGIDADTVTCTELGACPADGVSQVRVEMTETITIPLLGDRVAVLDATAAFACAP